MNKTAMDIFSGAIPIIVGIVCAFGHRFLGTIAARYQKQFLQVIGIRVEFSDQTVRAMQIAFLLAGLCFILFGLIALSRIIKL
jgi:MFS superfamily sulfate permease-like transporter